MFEAAEGAGAVSEVGRGLASAASAIWGDHRLRAFIEGERVPVEAKKKLIGEMAEAAGGGGRRGGLHPLVRNFLLLAIDKRREAYVPEAAMVFASLADRAAGVVNAEVRTAVELDDVGRRNLQEVLAGKFGDKLRLHFVVDPALVGGLVVKIEDRLFDASLKRRLARLGEHLAKARVGA